MLGRIEKVGGEHGVALNSPEVDAVSLQDNPLVLDVLAHLPDLLIFQKRLQLFQNPAERKLIRRLRKAMADGNVEGLMGRVERLIPTSSAHIG